MAKGIVVKFIAGIESSLNTKDKIVETTSGLDLRSWTTKYGQILAINCFPAYVNSELQKAQRDLYCCIDYIYKYLKQNARINLVSWFNSLSKKWKESYTMRATFFKFGLYFSLGDFLKFHLFLIAREYPPIIEENEVIYRAQVMAMNMYEIEQTFIEPRPKRW